MPNVARWRLELEDGTIWRGIGFGGGRAVAGEVVFNTGMTGYVEIADRPVVSRADPGADLSTRRQLRRAGAARAGQPRRSVRVDAHPGAGARRAAATSTRYSHHARARSLGAWLDARRRARGHRHRHAHADAPAARARHDARLARSPEAMTLEQARAATRDAVRDARGGVPRWSRRESSMRYAGGPARRSCWSTPAPRTTSCARCSSAARRVIRAPWHADLARARRARATAS